MVIIGTVVIQSATARPLARLLKATEPSPSGFLIIGANPVARALGKAIQSLGNQVLLTDSSWENIRAARMAGLPTYFGNPTSQHAEAHLDLVGLGHLLALSPSAELNALACMHFRHDFPGNRRFTLPAGADGKRSDKHRSSDEVRGLPLGSQASSYPRFASQLARGDEVRSTTLTQTFDWDAYQALHGKRATLILARDPSGWLHVATNPLDFTPGIGWTLTALIETEETPTRSSEQEEPEVTA